MFKPTAVLSRSLLMLCMLAAMPAFAAGDPLEGLNRRVMAFNDGADRIVLKPLTHVYRTLTPDFIERRVSSFFANLATPGVALNQLAQGKVGLAFSDGARFLVNSTLGFGGLFDAGTPLGLPLHDEDCSQTLAVWGIGSGPYVVVPLLGPNTVQTVIGGFCNRLLDPVTHVNDVRWRNSLTGLSLIDTRAQLLSAEKLITGDRYLFIRDAFLQRREYLDKDGQVTDSFLDDEP